MDLKAQSVDASFSLRPQSALVLYWLQSHFNVEERDELLTGQSVFRLSDVERLLWMPVPQFFLVVRNDLVWVPLVIAVLSHRRAGLPL